ncbi:MAG: MraY family glycosyltransferase [Desulfuromonadales bacterium]
MNLITCFFIFMTALFTALICVPFLRKWALDQGNLDIPDERKMHDTPMPRLGGIAIFIAFLFAVLVYVPMTQFIRGLLAGGLIVFVTGLVDDLTGLSAKRKFAGQVAACLTTIIVGKLWLSDLGNLFGFGDILLPDWIGIPFTVFAVVGVINAFNLIDGLDGLVGGLSIMALSAFFLIAWIAKDKETAFLTAALAGSLLGFLKYNFYPARIFMGDAGSLTVGFILGFLAIHTTQQTISTISPMVPVLILGLPLFDTLWVLSRRVLHHISPFEADRTHMHHKFLDLGFEHRFTVITIYSIMLFWISAALLFRNAPEYLLLFFLLISALLFYLFLRYILRHPYRFTLLHRDSVSGLRSSVTYLRMVDFIDHLVPLLAFLLAGYLLLASWSVVVHDTLSWKVAIVLLCAGLYLWWRPLTESRQILMLVLYLAVFMASLEVWHAEEAVINGLSIKFIGDALLIVASLIAIIKILFRRENELLLSTVDYLVLAICIFLSIAAQQSALGFNLNGPLSRAMVALLVVRTLCSRSTLNYRVVAVLSFGFLAFVSVRGLIG